MVRDQLDDSPGMLYAAHPVRQLRLVDIKKPFTCIFAVRADSA